MFAGLRPRWPRHGTVIACLALFVALGGSAYAANEWTGDNIVDESLTGADIQGTDGTPSTAAVNGSITSADISGQQANTANGTTFVDGTLTTWDIKNHSVRGEDLIAGTITGPQIGANAVSGDKVADGSLGEADLAPGSIDGRLLAPDAVSGDKVADGSLTGSDVQDNSLTGDDIGPSAIGSSEIATDAVGATEVQDDSIDTGEIVDNSLAAADLAAGSVGSSELQADAVDSSKVVDNSLTLADIKGANVAGSVTFSAGAVATGSCKDFSITTTGSKVGEGVVISLRGAVAEGMLFYGVRVAVDDHAIMKVCNFTGAPSPAISNLPVRVITFG